MNIEDEFNRIMKENAMTGNDSSLSPKMIEEALKLTDEVKNCCEEDVLRCLYVIANHDESLKECTPKTWMSTIMTIIVHLVHVGILTINKQKGE